MIALFALSTVIEWRSRMNIFLILAFLFFVGSMIGWNLELLFRKFFSLSNPEHRWVNPGFLIGPYLPLYGSSLCLLYLIAEAPLVFIENVILRNVLLVLICGIIMTLLEYITGYIFIITMNVRLWDYSNNRGNIKGLICPQFSFYWTILGGIYVLLIHPHILVALDWLSKNLIFSFVIGFFYGIFVIDIVYSFNLVTKVRAFAKEHELVVRYELLKEQIKESSRLSKRKIRFFFIFNEEISFKDHLLRYIELKEVFDDDLKTRIKEKLDAKLKKKHKNGSGN